VTITSLCIASQAPPTTALRWINRLEQEGHIERTPDADDKRRIYVRLTPRTIAALDQAMDGFMRADSNVRCGAGR
jgi:DNA-binding MarR family transcriptional regulator